MISTDIYQILKDIFLLFSRKNKKKKSVSSTRIFRVLSSYNLTEDTPLKIIPPKFNITAEHLTEEKLMGSKTDGEN